MTIKRLLLTIATSLACIAAFAQGRIQFVNDSLHLVYYLPGGEGIGTLGGQPVWAGTSGPGGMPFTYTLVADFYLGTSSSSLSLVTTTTFSATAPGKFNVYNYQANGIPGGTTVYVVTQIRDTGHPAELTWTPSFDPGTQGFSVFYGISQEFSFVLGTSTSAYPPMTTTGALLGGGHSTWQAGTYNMDSLGSGWRGALAVGIPEPASFSLACLGAAAMLIRRCRK